MSEHDEKVICPNCNAKTTELFKCKDCGTIFCGHCTFHDTKGAVIETKTFCPNCKKYNWTDYSPEK